MSTPPLGRSRSGSFAEESSRQLTPVKSSSFRRSDLSTSHTEAESLEMTDGRRLKHTSTTARQNVMKAPEPEIDLGVATTRSASRKKGETSDRSQKIDELVGDVVGEGDSSSIAWSPERGRGGIASANRRDLNDDEAAEVHRRRARVMANFDCSPNAGSHTTRRREVSRNHSATAAPHDVPASYTPERSDEMHFPKSCSRGPEETPKPVTSRRTQSDHKKDLDGNVTIAACSLVIRWVNLVWNIVRRIAAAVASVVAKFTPNMVFAALGDVQDAFKAVPATISLHLGSVSVTLQTAHSTALSNDEIVDALNAQDICLIRHSAEIEEQRCQIRRLGQEIHQLTEAPVRLAGSKPTTPRPRIAPLKGMI